MAVETHTGWVARAEAAVAALRGVESARILADGEIVREIHVLSTSTRPAKMIVRDVQSVLVTRFGREIDYRVVSVAYAEPEKWQRSSDPTPRPSTPATPAAAAPPPAPVVAAPRVESAPPVAAKHPIGGLATPAPPPRATSPASVTSPRETSRETRRGGRDDRIRFIGVNLFVAGARTQAQVELRWKGLPRMGSASGWSTREGSPRLVAAATVTAVQEFLLEPVALAVEEVATVRLGRRRTVVVTLALLGHRQEKWLSGSCVVEQDLQQAVVLATLSALNRLVGGFEVKEPTEYVLRPTST